MLYKINDKFYIKVQGYYKEVNVKVNGSDLDITPNGKQMEINKVNNATPIDTRTHKDSIIKELSKSFSHHIRDSREITSETRTTTRNKRI